MNTKSKVMTGLLMLLLSVSTNQAFAEDVSQKQLETMQQFLSLMQGYYQVVDDVHRIASDPDKSAILQLQKIEEIYKQRGDRAEAIAILEDVVKTAKSPVVVNAASLMLSEALNETGRATQAVAVLKAALDKNLGKSR